MTERILIRNIEYWGPDGAVATGDIAIAEGKFAYVGIVPEAWSADRIIEGKDLLAMPGFINTHTHAAMSLFRSYADDMQLMDWLQEKIWPAEARLEADDVYWGTQLSIAEMLRTGTTTFADMYFFMPDAARAVAESGIRASLARGMAGVAPNAETALTESASFFREFHGAADGRITVMLGPHAPYTCPPAYLERVVSMAHCLKANIHIHLAETIGEVEDCKKDHGATPMALMERLGLLECGVLAAHCVHLSQEDIELMVRRNVRVAHNPGSNLKLASGIAPVPAMLKAGLCVALGTDGAASNNNLDMLEEVRLAATLHKANTGDPLAVSASEALQMATSAGALALGLEQQIGQIAPGKKADLTLWNMNGLHWQPRYDRISLLAYAANALDVHSVLVDGKVLLDNGEFTTIDIERLRHEVAVRSQRLTARN